MMKAKKKKKPSMYMGGGKMKKASMYKNGGKVKNKSTQAKAVASSLKSKDDRQRLIESGRISTKSDGRPTKNKQGKARAPQTLEPRGPLQGAARENHMERTYYKEKRAFDRSPVAKRMPEEDRTYLSVLNARQSLKDKRTEGMPTNPRVKKALKGRTSGKAGNVGAGVKVTSKKKRRR